MKTFSAKPHEVRRDWFVIDATDKVLGRLAVEVARRLRANRKTQNLPIIFLTEKRERLDRLRGAATKAALPARPHSGRTCDQSLDRAETAASMSAARRMRPSCGTASSFGNLRSASFYATQNRQAPACHGFPTCIRRWRFARTPVLAAPRCFAAWLTTFTERS